MEILRKAENLTEAYALLDPDRPEESSITFLIDELQLDPSHNDKTIFTGHRGSGKSTELARLEEMLQATHTVVRFNVEGLLNLGDVDYADLLVVLGLEVFKKASENRLKLDEEKLKNWCSGTPPTSLRKASEASWKAK
jgi:energy-coupling factor transporter ATP-binding protein EcfA2